MIGNIVYNVFLIVWEWECYNICRDDYVCLGYIYCVDYWICFFSYDRILVDVFLCNLCYFFEKICYLCMYKMIKELIKNVLFFNILSYIYCCFVMLSI